MTAASPEAPILHGGGITEAARAYGGDPADWLDLSTGINPQAAPLPPIPLEAWHRLPDRHLSDAARVAARHHYRAAHCLPLPVPGTQSVIQHLPKLADPTRPVAIVSPTYGEYARVLAEAGLAVERIVGLEDVRPEHGLVVVVNPNNPTGTIHSRTALLSLAEALHARGGRLHVDEAFGDGLSVGGLVGDGFVGVGLFGDSSTGGGAAGESLSPDAGRAPGLTVFRSFGKFFGLAGLRLGFVLAEEAVLERFANWLGPWPVSGPALVVARDLMSKSIAPIAQGIAARQRALSAVLAGAGLAVRGGTPLFTLVEHANAAGLHDHLCRHHILVRKFDYNPQWLRFGLTPDAAADQRLARVLSEMTS